MKKTHKNSTNVPKRSKTENQKFCIKKTYVHIDCSKVRSRAIQKRLKKRNSKMGQDMRDCQKNSQMHSCFLIWFRNINRLMSEELLSNDRRVEKLLTPPAFEPHALPTVLFGPFFCYAATNFILPTSFTSEWVQ